MAIAGRSLYGQRKERPPRLHSCMRLLQSASVSEPDMPHCRADFGGSFHDEVPPGHAHGQRMCNIWSVGACDYL